MYRTLVTGSLAVAALFTTASAEDIDVAGTWLTVSQTSKVEIYDCGDGTPCGRIAWIDPSEDIGEGVDANNPDPALRNEPLIGLKILHSFERRKAGWRGGKIYDPEDGKTYGAKLTLQEDGTLKVNGCVGPLCQTQIWTAAEPVE